MGTSQRRIMDVSGKVAVILKLGFMASNAVVLLALGGIGILLFSGGDVRASFLAAFDIMVNNGTTVSIAPRPLMAMFLFAAADAVLMAVILFLLHAVFAEMKEGGRPFSRGNTARIKGIAAAVMILSLVGSYSDALVDYYAIGELAWRVDVVGLIVGAVVYCIALVFGYGCELQRESDETL